MNTNFYRSLFSKEGEISSKRFFGSIILLISILYLGAVLLFDIELSKLKTYCWNVAFVTSAILVGGDTIKDIIKDIVNSIKKRKS